MTEHDDTLLRKPPTHLLEEPPVEKPVVRYGSIPMVDCPTLMLTVQGYEQVPIRVEMSERIEMGRAQKNEANIDLDDFGAYTKGVSRQHFVLMISDGLVKVMDLGSANGTYLNGRHLPPGHPHVLRDGDILLLGELQMQVNFEACSER